MSKKDEALKLALEALQYLCKPLSHGWDAETQKEKRDQAVTAIREALAEQPAQQQEPVAVVKALPMGHNQTDMHYAECQHLPVGTLLYTSPPASKPLTDEQKYALIEKHLGLKKRRNETVIDQYTGLFYAAKPYLDLIDEAAHGIKGEA